MNIARTLCFKQELKEKSVLLDLDAVQLALIAESSTFILNFNPSVVERTDKLCIDIHQVACSKRNCWSDKESDEELKSFCLEGKFESFFDRGIKSIKGQYMKDFKRSVLAILSSKSSLMIYLDNFEDPHEALDFHAIMRNASIKSSQVQLHSLNSEKVRREMFEVLFSSKLNALCMCWSVSSMNSSDAVCQSTAYFAVSHSLGFITVWETNVRSGSFDLMCGIDVNDIVVEEMVFFSCGKSTHLCMSFRDGRVCLVEFLSNEGSPMKRLDITYIWDDKDYIPTNGIVFVEQQQMLVIPKNQHLVFLSFDLSDEKKKVFSLQILPIDTRFYISSVVPFKSEIVLTTFDGLMFRIGLSGENKLLKEQMMLPWNVKDWNIYGARRTKNSIYLVIATYPSKFYCNRIVKQPSLVHLIPIATLEDIGQLIINHLGPVSEIYDALCHLKFELARGCCWPQSLIEYMDEADDLDSFSLQKLKVLRCILFIRVSYLKEEEKDFKDRLVYCIRRIEMFILMYHIQATFGMVYSLNSKSLSHTEKSSLSLMKTFMTSNSMNSNFVLLEAFSHEYNEVCLICQEAVKFDDHSKGSCVNGHVFARCCQSLLLCSNLPYRTCNVCKSSAIKKPDECSIFGNVLTDTCTYCDGQLKLIEGF